MSKPRPADWNKTLADLVAELSQGKRRSWSIYDDEYQWAVDYEVSMLPLGTVLPRVGQVWEVIHDCEATVGASLAGEIRVVGSGRLQQGESVRIVGVDDRNPLLPAIRALRHDELHERLVPEDIRRRPGYRDYSLCVGTAYLNEHFRLVENVV